MARRAYPFSLQDQSGRTHTLDAFAGKWLVLYFYPKDDTPGCTVEACSIRDAYQDIINLGAEVIGISKDTSESHQRFASKYKLNFTLLSDPEGTTIKAYGASGNQRFGHEGILRKTFIIDPKGVIRKIYESVTPDGHGNQLIAELTALQQTNEMP